MTDSHIEEHVVLVDEHGTPIGTAPKSTIHTFDVPLHRGFSLFIFNSGGKLLLQQRSGKKITWPLTWTNSCCGHPAMGESAEDAACRRAKDELGLIVDHVHTVLPDYRYRFEKDGIVENEVCPVMVVFTADEPHPNPDEVGGTRWVPWKDFVEEIRAFPERYSPWCAEETLLLDASDTFAALLKKRVMPSSTTMEVV